MLVKVISKAYIKQFIMLNETFDCRLLSIHNIYFLENLMKEIRENIKAGTLEQYRDKFILSYYGEGYEYK